MPAALYDYEREMNRKEKPHSEFILENADRFEKKVGDPCNTDDPRWLNRIARNLKKAAHSKEKAYEHKQNQKGGHRYRNDSNDVFI